MTQFPVSSCPARTKSKFRDKASQSQFQSSMDNFLAEYGEPQAAPHLEPSDSKQEESGHARQAKEITDWLETHSANH